jgi:rhodanese-related sulfurtransferase
MANNCPFQALRKVGTMSLFKKLFCRKIKKAETQSPVHESIAPTQFRKEEFAFDSFQDLSATEAARKVEQGEVQVLDVRFEYEYRSHRIPGAKLIPLPQLAGHYQELDPTKPTLVVCEHGMRSVRACSFLGSKGFSRLYNMVGGMSEYLGRQEGESAK